MKHSRIGCLLASIIIVALLIPLSANPVHAGSERLFAYPGECKIGGRIEIDGVGYSENEIVVIYLSSMKAQIGDEIGVDVTAYEQAVIRAFTDSEGSFYHTYVFYVPDALTQGTDIEDVHSGDYYLYATYFHDPYILAIAELTILHGEIELDVEEGIVGTGVSISGQGLRPNQAITIKYDGTGIGITSGDSQTDENGSFSCAVTIPESSAGSHVISAVDESGNAPEAEFTVKPKIIIDSTDQAAGGEVQFSGTGFGQRQAINITLDDKKVDTTPSPLNTNHYGSFEGSFQIPLSGSYGIRKLEVADFSENEVILSLTIGAGLDLRPATSPTSPGYSGLELGIYGAGFTDGATVTISYSNNGEAIPVAEADADEGDFWMEFIIPPSSAGSHEITATDGTSTATAVFTMESQPPPTPIPLTPEVAGTAAARAYFDWEEVSDTSGVSYTLQVAVDTDFNAIVLKKEGLSSTEYMLTEEEELTPTENAAPYYWRIKAVDGASNESEWTYPRLFYIGFSWAALPGWLWYMLGGIGLVLLGIVGFWLQRRIARGKRDKGGIL